MNPQMKREVEYLDRHLQPLAGHACIRIELGMDEAMGQVWPVLVLTKPNGVEIRVEVSMDPEGNGPGHLMVEQTRAARPGQESLFA